MKVVITIPAYNEEKTIAKVINEIMIVMGKEKYDYKIIVVDDGSKDNTLIIAKKSGALVFSHPRNLGLAETFNTEMQKCLEIGADVIVHTDADGQYRAGEIPKLIDEVKKGNDLVLGSRFKGKIEHMPLIKRIGNISFSRVVSQIIRQNIIDTQTGFRAFTKEVAKILITSNYTYTQEQIIRAAKSNFRIKEIPVYFAKRGAKTKSRLMKNPLDYAIKGGINLIRIYRDYEPLKFFGMMGGSFLTIGLLIGIWFIYLHFTSGIVGHLGLITLMLLLFMTGIQILVFGFLADMYKK